MAFAKTEHIEISDDTTLSKLSCKNGEFGSERDKTRDRTDKLLLALFGIFDRANRLCLELLNHLLNLCDCALCSLEECHPAQQLREPEGK